MKIPQMIAAEFRRLTASPMAKLALFALMTVPLLYGGLYLWANQDPYARLDQVPVALVMADTGAVDGDGTNRNIGRDVAEQLIDDGTFDWQRVDAAGAAAGVADQAFDFSITIPADFTAALQSASGDAPRRAELVLSTNDANSYLASTIGEQAIERVRATVAEQVGEEAARTLLSSVQEIRTGIADAAGGAGQLRDGLEDARDGQSQLADGAGRLADGGSRLATGAGQLADGTAQLATGSAALADGTAQLAAGAHELAAGAARVADGNAELADTADRIGAAVDRAAGLLPEARTEVETRLVAAGVDRATIDEVLGALDPVADKLADGNAQVQSTVSDIDALSSGAAQVSDGAATLAGKLDDAAAGAQTLASGAAGARDGAAGLRDGAADLRDGAATLDDGIGALGDGLARLDDGAGTLADGLDDAVGRIPAASSETVDAQASVIADPVALETSAVTEADSYGAGLAPFFASLAGWIGIYALFLIVKPISRRAVTALHSPIKVTLAGWLTPGILGAVQMVALYGILSLALGFSIANPWGTVGVMLLASLTFAAIILALNVWLGSVGQFVGLVLMVVQLVTAGGTFPWQTLPAPLAWLHHFMPMSFAVDAMRQFMYGGDLARAGSDALVLGGILVGALAITALGVTRMTHTRTLRDLQPSLIG